MLMQKIKRLSIATQAGLLMGAMLIGTASVLFFWATENGFSSEVRHARTVADMADSFRTLASKHAGFYVRRSSVEDVAIVGAYLSEFKSEKVPGQMNAPEYVFHQKNPFLALADYSNTVQASAAAAKFRITSDNYMNPANSPDLFDLESIKVMRETGATENWQVVGSQVRFARALVADQSCMRCHNTPETAPSVVRAKYPGVVGGGKKGGYGYVSGEVVGITSVMVPHASVLSMLMNQSFLFWLSTGLVLGLMALSYLLALKGVVAPLRKLAAFSHATADANDASELKALKPPRFERDERSSKNEIHTVSFALKALHQSMWTAMGFIDEASRSASGAPKVTGVRASKS